MQGTQPNGCGMCAYLMSGDFQENPVNPSISISLFDEYVEESRALYQIWSRWAIYLPFLTSVSDVGEASSAGYELLFIFALVYFTQTLVRYPADALL